MNISVFILFWDFLRNSKNIISSPGSFILRLLFDWRRTPGSFTAFHSKIFFLSSKFFRGSDLALLTVLLRCTEWMDDHNPLTVNLDCVQLLKSAIRIQTFWSCPVLTEPFSLYYLAMLEGSLERLVSPCFVNLTILSSTCLFLDNFPTSPQEFPLAWQRLPL